MTNISLTEYRAMNHRLIAAATLLLLVSTLPAKAQNAYDVVILGGRVMDPETGRDEIANVGIADGQIRAITVDDITGRQIIDASGQIVAPGFIDILASMRQEKDAHEFKIGDGVTTVLGMHGGPIDVAGYARDHAAVGPLVNYAATVSLSLIHISEPTRPERIGVCER